MPEPQGHEEKNGDNMRETKEELYTTEYCYSMYILVYKKTI